MEPLPPEREGQLTPRGARRSADPALAQLSSGNNGHQNHDAASQRLLPQDSHRRHVQGLNWRTRLSNAISNEFCLEIISSLSSIAVTIALLAILYAYSDRALPSWPWGITVCEYTSRPTSTEADQIAQRDCLSSRDGGEKHATLAVAEGISQYKWLYFRSKKPRPLSDMQTFDAASRGPWGALKMLTSLRLRFIASLGCFITIICLALDPFAQQVLVYRSRLVPVGNARIASTTVYYGPSDDNFASIESPMLEAIYSGILEDGTTQPLAPFCATGNCTFEPFISLGFCSECCDLTTSLTRVCHNTDDSTLVCKYIFPGAVSVYMNNSKPLELMNLFPWPANSTQASEQSSSCDIKALGNSVISFGMLEIKPGDTILAKQASFCALFPCIQRHNTSVQAGVASSSILSTWRNSSDNMYVGDPSSGNGLVLIWDPEAPHAFNQEIEARSEPSPSPSELSPLPSSIAPPGGVPPQPPDTTLIEIGFNKRLNYSWVVFDDQTIQQLIFNMSTLLAAPLGLGQDEITVHEIQREDTMAELGDITTLAMIFFPTRAISKLRLLLLNPSSSIHYSDNPSAQLLVSTIDYSLSEVPAENALAPPKNSPIFRISQKRFFALNAWFSNAFNGTVSQSYDLLRGTIWQLDQITASSDLMSVIYNSGNITKTMNNLATSMSNYIRSSSHDLNNTENTAEGKALGMETYVHVRWAWLTLPVACVLLAFVFLICAILSTKKHGDLAWKSSVLALLFHGLEGQHRDQKPLEVSTRRISDMKDVARSIRVRLVDDDSGTLRLQEG